MNENENNVNGLQNDGHVEPTLEFSSPKVPTAEVPTPTEVPTPSDPTPVISGAPSNSNEPSKKNNKLLIIIIVVVLVLGVGAWYLCTQTDLFETNTKEEAKKDSKKNKDKDTDKDDDKTDRGDDLTDEELAKVNGSYESGENSIKIYPLESGSVFFYVNDFMTGFGEVDGNVIEESAFGESVTFEVNGDEIVAKFTEYPEYDGTYKRKSGYTQKDLINDLYGDYEMFNNSYNGHYSLNDDDMYIFQIDEDTVRVVILAEEAFSSLDIEFGINSDGSLTEEFFDNVFTVKFEGDNAIFSTEGEDNEHDGTYKKVGSVNIDDILDIGLY